MGIGICPAAPFFKEALVTRVMEGDCKSRGMLDVKQLQGYSVITCTGVALNHTATSPSRTQHHCPTHRTTSMELNQLAVPAVYALIFLLGYPSQALFLYLDPAPLTKNELIWANVLLVCIFITYTQSVFVDPGTIPKKEGDGKEKELGGVIGNGGAEKLDGKKGTGHRTKWCRKCNAAKPPRAHHCKECKR